MPGSRRQRHVTSDPLHLPSDRGVADAPDERPSFRVEVSRDGDNARLRLTGELDLDTTPILQAEIAALRETGSRSLVLDLTGLDFIDSSGLHCILDGTPSRARTASRSPW